MPHILLLPFYYAIFMYLSMTIIRVLGDILGLFQVDSTKKDPDEKIVKNKNREKTRSDKPNIRHKYNLRSRTRKGPKHRPAFGGLAEI